MPYYETEHLDDSPDAIDLLNEVKKLDRGHARIWGFIERQDGSLKRTTIDIYARGFMGNRILDAETGKNY